LAVTAGAAEALEFAGMAQTVKAPSYVALGDSYAAGIGAPPALDTRGRTANGYALQQSIGLHRPG
jgi:hypothetical protein